MTWVRCASSVLVSAVGLAGPPGSTGEVASVGVASVASSSESTLAGAGVLGETGWGALGTRMAVAPSTGGGEGGALAGAPLVGAAVERAEPPLAGAPGIAVGAGDGPAPGYALAPGTVPAPGNPPGGAGGVEVTGGADVGDAYEANGELSSGAPEVGDADTGADGGVVPAGAAGTTGGTGRPGWPAVYG
jgi:hypothetical protein